MPTRIQSDLKSVGDILKTDFRYKVPTHQRNFSWTDEEVDQLWDDILDALQDPKGDYFLGTIVLQENKEEKIRTIIDGQQRLSCLTMLFSAIRAVYTENNDERADEVHTDYLGVRDRRSRLIEPRLTMNEVNEPMFQQLVVEVASDKDLDAVITDKSASPSNVLLAKAARFLRKAVRERAGAEKSYDTFILELEDFLRERVVLIQVAVDDEADAFLIFETLNDRGLELSITDLLKNYIFGRAGSRLGTVRRQWEETIFLLGNQNAAQFLRHYWLSKYGVVRERDLYREIKKKFASPSSVLKLMSELRDSADNYAAMANVDHAFWTGYGQGVRKDLESLQLFSLSQFRPLLLASMDVMPAAEIAKIIRMIVVVSMRYSIIGSLGTGNIEKAYSDAAVAVRNGKAKKAAKAFDALKTIYPDDSRFRADFAVKSITKAKLARHVLSEIVNMLGGSAMYKITEDEKVSTLEHIMPKAQSGHWAHSASSEEEYHEYVNRLGNLTLIERSLNKAAANDSFTSKKKVFAKSHVAITKDLAAISKWTTAEIDERQDKFAKTAVKVWALPYK